MSKISNCDFVFIQKRRDKFGMDIKLPHLMTTLQIQPKKQQKQVSLSNCQIPNSKYGQCMCYR
jgi:hypothetical protein